MEFIDNYSPEKEFHSTRTCSFCNSADGKTRMVGNYIVKLSKITLKGTDTLACQGCRIKQRNYKKIEEKFTKKKKRFFLRNLFGIDFFDRE